MALDYPSEWKFGSETPPAPIELVANVSQLLLEIAGEASDPWSVVEGFKTDFGNASRSTSLSWAQDDLSRAVQERTTNSVRFIESFWRAIQRAERKGLKTPTQQHVNEMLLTHGLPFQLKGNQLVKVSADAAHSLSSHREGSSQALPYELGDKLDEGGFGVVYRATRETQVATFEYAFKLLHPSAFVDREKALARFQREVRAVALLQHRAIVPYLDAGMDLEGRPYLVMPLIRGQNVRDFTEGADPRVAIDLMIEVLHGVEHAHSRQVLHRDLKPRNIMVRNSDGQPIILDFGTAFFLDDLDARSLTSSGVGSAGYMPPEVLAKPKYRTRFTTSTRARSFSTSSSRDIARIRRRMRRSHRLSRA